MDTNNLTYRIKIDLGNGKKMTSEPFESRKYAVNAREDLEHFFPEMKVAIIGQVETDIPNSKLMKLAKMVICFQHFLTD